ncbi:MAG: hypothetical protein FWG21_03215 [Oscillospiraceae bacterium]|nr:hypothetical protein [Oscillospiraceae bacterium]
MNNEDSRVIYKAETVTGIQQESTNTYKDRRFFKELLRMLLMLIVVAVLVVGILYVIAEIAGYETIGSLVEVMRKELIFVFERIIRV